ncbi:substrate-binding periplasmic protein [Pseudoalteromonas sp. SSDWG2]|uniref:substrate-binding periplasmic protein n=1 Tax=Pseudoalteromonas sp. SSDWG2 TaxID=3139391 RepID=UPI003BAB2745
MNKILISFLLSTIVCFWTSISYANEKVYIVTEVSPPNQILINDSVGGSSTDIVRQIINEARIDAEFSIFPWARAYHLAHKTPNTLIYSMAKTPEREQQFHWIGKVGLFRLGFVTLASRDDVSISTLDDARRYRIAVQRDDVSALYLEEHGFATIHTTDIKQSYQLLLSGKVDVVIDDPNYMHSMAKQFNVANNDLRFIMAVEELSVYGYLAANIDTDPAILTRLQEAFNKVSASQWYTDKLTDPYAQIQAYDQ